MIHCNRFVVGHIGKTGGDAVKQYTAALNLPGLTCYINADRRKHLAPWQLLDMQGRDLILTIRRLPAYEISFRNQLAQCAGRPLPPRNAIARVIIQEKVGERSIRCMTNDGQYAVRWYIRSESLWDDLLVVYRHYFDITPEQAARAAAIETKPRRNYDHNLSNWLTQDEVDAIYAASPTWSMHELKAYGALLASGPQEQA